LDNKSKILFTGLFLFIMFVFGLSYHSQQGIIGFVTNPNACSDSDGGLNTTVWGNVSGYSINKYYNKKDTCASATMIREYYCKDTSAVLITMSCGASYYSPRYCSGKNLSYDRIGASCIAPGVCIETRTTLLAKVCPYACESGVCVARAADSCKDTDGGNVTNVSGTVSGVLGGSSYNNSDSCQNPQDVTEYYCSGNYKQTTTANCGNDYNSSSYCVGNARYKNVTDYYCEFGACRISKISLNLENCTYGCTNEICNGPSTYICADTDGGIATTVKGTVAGINSGVTFNNTDFCSSTSAVTEYYCSETGYSSSSINCTAIGATMCTNGTCI
jgi:hypothetical protein